MAVIAGALVWFAAASMRSHGTDAQRKGATWWPIVIRTCREHCGAALTSAAKARARCIFKQPAGGTTDDYLEPVSTLGPSAQPRP